MTADHTPERLSAWTAWFHRELVNCVHPVGTEPQCEAWTREALTTGPAAHLADVEARLAAVWDEGVDAAFRGAVTRQNGEDVKRRNPYRATLHPDPSEVAAMSDDFRFGDPRGTDASDDMGGCCGKPTGCRIESRGCVRKPEKADWRALADAQTARDPDPSEAGA